MISSRELIVDLFAGGGGASTGIYLATGRHPDIAINHSPAAVAFHARNHPTTRHYCEDVFDVHPRAAVGKRKVGILWASPDCTHHSRAKGGKPRDRKRRALAKVVTRWAALVRPRIICLENVAEFQDWGPLDDSGHPIKARAGEEFDAWVADLELQGYAVEWRMLVAADYGAPTTRKRLYMIARCDGAPIVWPEPTHGAGRARPWRAASECIDFSLPCPSIFMSRAEAKAWARANGRTQPPRRPLAEKTMARIARGLDRFVLRSARPFIVPVTHDGGLDRCHNADEPLRTVTCANRGELALVAPTLVQTGYGERPGQAPRVLDLAKPLGTAVAGGSKVGVVSAWLVKHFGGPRGGYGSALDRAMDTVTCRDHHALAVTHLTKLYGTSTGADVSEPMPTVTATGNHIGEVRALLIKYYGQGVGQRLEAPLDTITTRARFGIVTVDGVDWQIADIGMRMLVWRELFRAQGFPDECIENVMLDGAPLTDEQLVELAGNSVCPPVAAAIALANCAQQARRAA